MFIKPVACCNEDPSGGGNDSCDSEGSFGDKEFMFWTNESEDIAKGGGTGSRLLRNDRSS
jgi:hypothetical protein